MNSSLITILNDFKDDKEVLIIKVVFSEATVPAETFAYSKLMGPESNGRVTRVRPGVTSNQFHAKCNHESGVGALDLSIVSLLLKEVQSLCKENQRSNRLLASEKVPHSLAPTPRLGKKNDACIKDSGQLENSTVLRDKGGIAPTSRSLNVVNQSNSLEGVNKSCTTQISKEHVGVTNGMENFAMLGDGTENQVEDQNTPTGENKNTSRYSKQPNIVRRLNFDERVQLNCIQGVRKGPSLTSMTPSISKEGNSHQVINPLGIKGQTKQQKQFTTTKVSFFPQYDIC
ncbi:hypothetical protein Cgig2_000373 [Carnegiea gigantea]|uniref:Uncharacterized protein n=1 Tax=Carnegiea gigantea TaxID=171969 RepID=A0A9Q1JQ65_9CARY|nr:hypothetical protein Cgig2_000373 [Carnegiea gigantea]